MVELVFGGGAHGGCAALEAVAESLQRSLLAFELAPFGIVLGSQSGRRLLAFLCADDGVLREDGGDPGGSRRWRRWSGRRRHSGNGRLTLAERQSRHDRIHRG